MSSLNPWSEKGIPLDRQYRSWNEITPDPYDKHTIDAYSRVRIILMNGVENEVWVNSHNFARCTDNREIKELLAMTRRVEDQQQTTINWLNPPDQTVIETTIAYEQVAIDLTAYLARNEPDPYLRETLNFGLLEDLDHLYRYSELLDYLEGKDANSILQGRTELIPGRPTEFHHNDPTMRLRRHWEKNRAHPVSKIHVLTLLSGEQQTRNYYKSHGYQLANHLARQLYAEIGEVEEEHVTQYESLMDPAETPLQKQVLHELMEVYNYFHCLEQEPDPRLKAIWDQFLHMELEHLQLWGNMLRKYEGVEPEVLFGKELTVDFRFEENKQYVRDVLDTQHLLRLLPDGYTSVDQLPGDWPSWAYLDKVNKDGVPSNRVMDLHNLDGRQGDELLARARSMAGEIQASNAR